MVNLRINNLSEETLNEIPGGVVFADANKGKFLLMPASLNDELTYLVSKLNKRGLLKWKPADGGDRFKCTYGKLKITISTGLNHGDSLVIELNKKEHVLSNSALTRELAHDIWHITDHPHGHFNMGSMMGDYYEEQRIAGEKALKILKT